MSEVARFQRFFEDVLGLDLEPFKQRIAREVFSKRREALILLPRGNGKSTLLAGIALWHLLSAKEPRVAIGAASREQAAVLFDIARGMAAHPLIAPRVEVTRREIRTPKGWLKVISSDGPKQHGPSNACSQTRRPGPAAYARSLSSSGPGRQRLDPWRRESRR